MKSAKQRENKARRAMNEVENIATEMVRWIATFNSTHEYYINKMLRLYRIAIKNGMGA